MKKLLLGIDISNSSGKAAVFNSGVRNPFNFLCRITLSVFDTKQDLNHAVIRRCICWKLL